MTWSTTVQDARILLGFRTEQLRGRSRRRAKVALLGLVLVTLAAAWLPQYVTTRRPTPLDVLVLMPTAYLAFFAIILLAAAASGGGRELISKDEATPYPISAKTDFLLGVMLAPLNVAWLMESWLLLGSMSYGMRGHGQVAMAQVVTFAWIGTATVLGQAVAAAIEYVRRLPGGVLAVRSLAAFLAVTAVWLVVSHRLGSLLDNSRVTTWIVGAQTGLIANRWWQFFLVLGACVAVTTAAVVIGAWLVERAARRQAVEDARLESGQRTARPHPTTDFFALLRIDRASVWRAVPLRRGILFLGVLPGAVALAGSLHWQVIALFPGLVASGAALLFGVNIWCLDAKGALWRESLPVRAQTVFAVRAWVLGELFVAAMVPALILGALRAGLPSAGEIVSVLCASAATVVVVAGRCLRWSIVHPYPADLRGARATPAPPLAMVAYSARLALLTTLLGLFFYGTSSASPGWAVLVAAPVVLFGASDLLHTARLWDSAETRAVVLTAVAA